MMTEVSISVGLNVDDSRWYIILERERVKQTLLLQKLLRVITFTEKESRVR